MTPVIGENARPPLGTMFLKNPVSDNALKKITLYFTCSWHFDAVTFEARMDPKIATIIAREVFIVIAGIV